MSPDRTPKYDLAVAGAGPAGTAAAITAARAGARVVLLERGRYPRHKVCGEFVSPEGVELLRQLDSAKLLEGAPRLPRTRIFVDGTTLQAPVDPPAVSIPRYSLDEALWQAAARADVDCLSPMPVTAISGSGPVQVETPAGTLAARAVIVAAGRWSNLRHTSHDADAECWIGLKAHFFEDHPPTSTDLYFFSEGYCGVQPLGRRKINVCAMARKLRTLEEVFTRHPELQRRSRDWERATEVVSTAPLMFTDPVPERDGVLYAGDAAGFIDPFLGDGISIALRSGVMAAKCLQECWRGREPLDVAAARYADRYRLELLPLFRQASVLRKLMELPGPLRKPILMVLQAAPIARFLVNKTRQS
jgi:flavin-dependent dehydrogenase